MFSLGKILTNDWQDNAMGCWWYNITAPFTPYLPSNLHVMQFDLTKYRRYSVVFSCSNNWVRKEWHFLDLHRDQSRTGEASSF